MAFRSVSRVDVVDPADPSAGDDAWTVLRDDIVEAADAEIAACLAEPEAKPLARATVTERPLIASSPFAVRDGTDGEDDGDGERVWLRSRTKARPFEDSEHYWLRPRTSQRPSDLLRVRLERREGPDLVVSLPVEDFDASEGHPGYLLCVSSDIALSVASAAADALRAASPSSLLAGLFDGGELSAPSPLDEVLPDGVDVSSMTGPQRDAVALALSDGPALVWGPPGCGKTTVIAAVLEANLAAGRSTLVVSNNNVAVDGAALATVRRIGVDPDDPDALAGKVIRPGSGVRAEVAAHRFLTPDAAAEVLCGADERRAELEAESRALAELSAAIDVRRAEIDEMVRRHAPPADVQAATRQLKVDVDRLDGRRRRLTESRSTLEGDVASRAWSVLASAPVVATTLATALLNRNLAARTFDTVLIDEAAAAAPFLAAAVALRARSTVVLVGDFRQNTPVTRRSKLVDSAPVPLEGRAGGFADGDVFSLAGVASPSAALEHPRCAVLTTQFRFPTPVADLVNSFAYGGLLQSPPEAQVFDGGRRSPVFFVDVDGPHAAPLQREGGSRWWTPGLEVVSSLLARHTDPSTPVGVVVPYVAQARRLNELAAVRAASHVEVGTIHECQGREWPVVIFDLMQDDGGPSWASAGNFDGDERARAGARIFNVALTRMQRRLYVVGSRSALERLASPSRPAVAALDAAIRAGVVPVVSAEETLRTTPQRR